MASYKLNMARIRGCPGARQVVEAMEEFGLPDTEEFGVLAANGTQESAFGTIVRKTHQAIQRLDAEARDVTADVNSAVLAYMRSVNVFGMSGRVEAVIPYVDGHWEGFVEDEFREADRTGLADPRIRFALNFFGAPALTRAKAGRLSARRNFGINTTTGRTSSGRSVYVRAKNRMDKPEWAKS